MSLEFSSCIGRPSSQLVWVKTQPRLTDFARPRWLAGKLAGTSFPFRPSPPAKDYIALDGATVWAEDTIGFQLYRYVVLLAVGNVSVFHCLRSHLQRPRVLCSGHADQHGARIVSLRATFERRSAAGVTVYTLLRTRRARGLNASIQGSRSPVTI